jgi:sugar transferase EpsL
VSSRRVVDVVVASFALAVLSPVMAVVAIIVRLRLGTPVIFRQERPGRHGEPFMIVKFRSMRDDRGPDGALLADEARLTRFGRFLRSTSLDELPELVNVVRGEMSLIGPRPLRMAYLPLYSPEQSRRHEVKPGITGLAQVAGRNALTWDEKFALDLRYVTQQSFWLDVRIVVRTIAQIFKFGDISAEGHATTPDFTGSLSQELSSR